MHELRLPPGVVPSAIPIDPSTNAVATTSAALVPCLIGPPPCETERPSSPHPDAPGVKGVASARMRPEVPQRVGRTRCALPRRWLQTWRRDPGSHGTSHDL